MYCKLKTNRWKVGIKNEQTGNCLSKKAKIVMEGLYKDLERRIESSPPGLCPVDMARAFLELCHAQTCGKCVPCRIGLGQLNNFIREVLDGKATMKTLDIMEQTALSIMESADCAIGYEAANMVYKGLIGYRDDYVEHIRTEDVPVPIISRYHVYLYVLHM